MVDRLVLIPGLELKAIAIATRAYTEVEIAAFIAPLIQDESLTAGMPSGKSTQNHLDANLADNYNVAVNVYLATLL